MVMQASQTSLLNKPGLGRLALLSLASFLLANTVVLGVLAPFPLAIGVILFGRTLGYGATSLVFGVSCLILLLAEHPETITPHYYLAMMMQAGYYTVFLAITVLSAETVLRSWKPTRVITVAGLGLFCLALFSIYLNFSLNQLTTHEVIASYLQIHTDQVDQLMRDQKDNFEFVALISQPEKLAQMVNQEFPRILFLVIMFSVWANIGLSLKAKRMTHLGLSGYSQKDVIHFEVYDSLIYGVIGALVFYLLGEYITPWASEFGKTMLYVFGTFYFFKGFGIFINLLDLLKFIGFLRAVMVIFSVLLLKEVMALVGMFDMWFNFNQKIIAKKNTQN